MTSTLKLMINKLIQECRKEKIAIFLLGIDTNGSTTCMTVLPEELNIQEDNIKAFIEKEDKMKESNKLKKHTKEYELNQKRLEALNAYNRCLQARLNFDRNDYE